MKLSIVATTILIYYLGGMALESKGVTDPHLFMLFGYVVGVVQGSFIWGME